MRLERPTVDQRHICVERYHSAINSQNRFCSSDDGCFDDSLPALIHLCSRYQQLIVSRTNGGFFDMQNLPFVQFAFSHRLPLLLWASFTDANVSNVI